jgi:hypothetical protein
MRLELLLRDAAVEWCAGFSASAWFSLAHSPADALVAQGPWLLQRRPLTYAPAG